MKNTCTVILHCEFFCRFLSMLRGEINKKMLVLEEKTMREGEMWGFHMSNLDDWMENGNLAIKCIIYHLQL